MNIRREYLRAISDHCSMYAEFHTLPFLVRLWNYRIGALLNAIEGDLLRIGREIDEIEKEEMNEQEE